MTSTSTAKALSTGKIRTSIFGKLFLVLLVAGGLIYFAFATAISLAFRPHFGPHMSRFMEKSVSYLVTEIGEPPNFEKGQALAKELDIGIRVEGNGWTWSSAPDLPPISEMPHHGPHPKWKLFRTPPKFGPHVVIDHQFAGGPAKVLVTNPRRPEIKADYGILGMSLAIVTLILIASYLAIRRILRPLSKLNEGVEAIASGNLKHQVPIDSTDELGRLASAFNLMVKEIGVMIHSKQQLLIDVSHELRSPLTRAKLGLELMEQDESIAQVTQELNELEQMIEELLQAARLESGHGLHLQSCNLVQLVKTQVEHYREVGKVVEFSTSVGEISASLDPHRMTSVVRNLIDNALKYSPEGSSVSVKVFQHDEVLGFEVSDQGTGIPEEELRHVFEPFYRVDKSRNRKTGGFGLGLSLCKRIVDAHKGDISLVSLLGKGTTVSVRIPNI